MPSVLHALDDVHVLQSSFIETLFPTKPSAGYETGAIGAMALEGLVKLKTSNDLLSLAQAQAAKLRQTNMVAYLRSTEANNVVKSLVDPTDFSEPEVTKSDVAHFAASKVSNLLDQAAEASGILGAAAKAAKAGGAVKKVAGLGDDDLPKLRGQLASGIGFGLVDPKGRSYDKKPPPGVAPHVAEIPGSALDPEAKLVKLPNRPPDYDMASLQIREGLTKVVQFTGDARRKAEELQAVAEYAKARAGEALHLSAAALNYPGLPPEAVAPAALDFLYAGLSPGTDPYASAETGVQRA